MVFKTAIIKLKVDMKDLSIFQSIKQLYTEMMRLQKEINGVHGDIDVFAKKLYQINEISK